MEIAGAYAALANSGVRVAPNAIVGVMTGDGTVLDRKATVARARPPGRRHLPRELDPAGRGHPRHGRRRARPRV